MTRWIVSSIPLGLLVAILLIGLPALITGVQAVVRRRAPRLRRGDHNDVAGFLLAVTGVLYSVLAGFVIITLWEQFSEGEQIVATEESALRSLLRDTAFLGETEHRRLEQSVTAYLQLTVDEDWKAMADGRSSSAARTSLDDIYRRLHAATTSSPTDEVFLRAALGHLDKVSDARERRLLISNDEVPGVMWLALVLSTIITVAFCLMFGLDDARVHFLMVGAVSVLAGVILLQVLVLDFPFTGDVAVGADPLVSLLHELRNR